MKKIIVLVVTIILAMSLAEPVMATDKEKPIFDEDLSVCKRDYLSVYSHEIREEKNGKLTDCKCGDYCFCIPLKHILEDTTESNFYSAFFKSNLVNPVGGIYLDCSSSMEKTFCREKANILKNLSPFLNKQEKEIEKVFKNKNTNLYGLLSSFDNKNVFESTIISPGEIPIIITDLWDTAAEEEKLFKYEGAIVFCVPYASTNKEGVLHCEEVVNNLISNHQWLYGGLHIYVVYTDEVIVQYGQGAQFDILIYVP